MNKIIFVLLIVLGFSFNTNAQEDEKVKGDRNVTIKQTYINPFNRIVVNEDFTVELIFNSKPSVEIETDENLHEFINFEVIDSVLTFKTTKKITSSKKMNIKVNYASGLEHIETHDDAEIRSLTSLELNKTTLKTTGSSKAYLNIRATDFSFTSLDKAKVKLNLHAQTSKIELSDNSKLEALINSPQLTMDLYQRATANVEGTGSNILLRTDNNANFEGKNFTVKTCSLTTELDSEVNIEVTEAITIDASGSSEIYLYNNPKISINTFLDTAKLQKKVK